MKPRLIVVVALSWTMFSSAQTDTLTAWLSRMPADTVTLNILIEKCAEMLRNDNGAETMPLVNAAQQLGLRLLAHAGKSSRYSIGRKTGRAFVMEGQLHMYAGEKEAEHRCLMRALSIYDSTGNKRGVGIVYNNLGSGCLDQGDYTGGMKYFLKALRIMESIPDSSGIGVVCYSLGELYRRAAEPRMSLAYEQRCLQIKISLRDSFGIAELRNGIGNSYYAMERMDSAEYWFRSALGIIDTLGYTEMLAHVLHNLGNVSLERDHIDNAIAYYRRAMTLYGTKGQGGDLAVTTLNFGRALMFRGQYREARDIFLRDADSLSRYDNFARLENLYEYLVQCDSALGDFRGATDHARLWRELSVKNLRDRNLAEIHALQSRFDLQEKETENRRLTAQNQVQTALLGRHRVVIALLALSVVALLLVFVVLWQRQRHRAVMRAAELRQRLLRTQMNPHFIFNALQAIQNFVVSHNTKESVRYLESFAELTRDVLESSRADNVSLETEVRLAENYLLLQKARFGERFTYTVQVDPRLEPNSVSLPPMLSQPFIENAVEHGLAGIESGGCIEVSFSRSDDMLEMRIRDNGSGMAARRQDDRHASRAITITRERIEAFNRGRKVKATFVLRDAFPGHHMKGVEAVFLLPLGHA